MKLTQKIVELALREDLEPDGDISSQCLPDRTVTAEIIAKEPGVMSCSWLVELILEQYRCHPEPLRASGPPDHKSQINVLVSDKSSFQAGQTLVEIKADAKTILACERTILNFLQRLCGIASYTQRLVELIKDHNCTLLDTRKTMPGMRALEKQAFRDGGGTNHRFNLSDMVMLKENHLALAHGNLLDTIKQIRSQLSADGSQKKIEVEINKDNLDKLEDVIKTGVDQIMLDNFSPEEIKTIVRQLTAVSCQAVRPKVELSGGINESNLVDYACTGVDYISTSICFTQAKNIDLSMLIKA